ncbi:hypothetical protein HPB52_017512 [Rhipicephalus sanguineus]|uniref:Uncharacterized protein n=1 Tax=Rhipicephalus sanguineus TaxID=34632 RepID=A0A9D4QDX7_RHISA|nr:hypothetical protein HPB52_017512 [Rhipicephalus sanguineus]
MPTYGETSAGQEDQGAGSRQEAESASWRTMAAGKPGLSFYSKAKQAIEKEPLYENSKGSGLLCETRCGMLRTRLLRATYTPNLNTACPLCTLEEESIEHIVLRCPALKPQVSATSSAAATPPEQRQKLLAMALGFRESQERPQWETVASAKKLHPSGIIIILLYVGIVITLVVLTIALFTKNSAQQAQACTTSECHEYATLLASSVDASVSPCNSFARFVCGRWERSNALSVREFLYGRALDRMTSHIRTLEVPDSGQNDGQRAAAAFRSCDDVLNGRVDHLDTVKRTLGDAGIPWPRFPNRVDVLRTLLVSSLKLAWDVLLRVVPRCSGNTTTLTMNPGRHFYRIVEMATNSLSESEFKVYFNTLRNAFGSGRSDDNEASFAETAVLDKITSLTLVSKYHLGTSSPVPLDVPRDVGTEWLATLVHFGYNATAEVALVTTNPSFVGTFLDVWRRIGGNSTHLLISWSTVQVAALYANKDLIFNYYGGKTEVASVRYTAFCFSTAYLLSRGAPFARYEGETVSKEARANADAVMRSVSSAYIRRLSKWPHFKEDIKVVADWLALPSEAFHEAHVLATDDSCHDDGDKFPDLTDSLPYNWHSSSRLISNIPDDFYDVVRAISSLELSVPSSRSKTLRLLPLSLWFPLFDLGLASAINYAGIGGQVSSALSWLLASAYAGDSRTAEVIANLSACVERHSSSAVQLDSALSQALTAGPLVDAYEHGTTASDGRVGAYGGTQLLFVALCFFACAGRDNVVEGAVCDLAMRQSREFARVFKCAPGAPMNPKERCDLP